MPELIAVVDTGVLCCWLEVPGKETAGSGADRWDANRARSAVDEVIRRSGTLILPLSVTIETANHIAQAAQSRRAKAQQLFDRVVASMNGTHPWKRFDESQRLWTSSWYTQAQREWPDFADRGIGLADYSIAGISRYFFEVGSEVVTLTTDRLLAAEVGHLVPVEKTRRRPRR